MVDVAEILEHWYAGRPKVEVARSLGVDAKTSNYAARGVIHLMPSATLCRGTPEARFGKAEPAARRGIIDSLSRLVTDSPL